MIKVTRKQYERIRLAYRIGGFTAILTALFAYSWLIGKAVEFVCIFLPYFATKGFYRRQWHATSLKQCLLLSTIIFAFLTTIAMPKQYSLTTAVIIGLSAAYASYHAGEIQFKLKDYAYIEPRYTAMSTPKPFSTNTCTESELIERCKKLHFSAENTALAVEFFIEKTKQSIIAEQLCIDEKSVTIRKKRMKKKLNDFIDNN